ncbi:MAG: hypothetical protein M3Q71_13100 [Chloroflexota bacterium]|nr:hypothetical protein [Chloroflexota bacterium]
MGIVDVLEAVGDSERRRLPVKIRQRDGLDPEAKKRSSAAWASAAVMSSLRRRW